MECCRTSPLYLLPCCEKAVCAGCFRRWYYSHTNAPCACAPVRASATPPTSLLDLLPLELQEQILQLRFPCVRVEGHGDTLRRVTRQHNRIHSHHGRPAVEWLAGPLAGRCWFYTHGVIDRDPRQGPAAVFPDGSCWWVQHGKVVKAEASKEVEEGPRYVTELERYVEVRQLVFEFYCHYWMEPVVFRKRELLLPGWTASFFEKCSDKGLCVLGNLALHCGWEPLLAGSTIAISRIWDSLLFLPDGKKRRGGKKEIRRRFHIADDLPPQVKADLRQQNRYLLAAIPCKLY
jgi:hypothetical protein